MDAQLIKKALSLILLVTCSFCLNTYAAELANTTPAETSNDTSSISSNPAAVNVTTGSGVLQKFIEKKLHIQDNHGITFQGAWLGDTNQLFSGGIPDAKKNTLNSSLLLQLNIDTEKFSHWKGGFFSAQFLQVNAQDTNGQAGVVQGYNSIPGAPPLNRAELYELWYRQAFFNDKFFVRVGKTAPTLDFNNVIKPDVLDPGVPNIPAITSLIYTPIFTNTSMLGVIPGFYNSAYGLTFNLTPIRKWYLSYGVYDGNMARGKQTGLTGPTFNGNYFHIGETGAAWVLGKKQKPGNFAVGFWRQTGLILNNSLTEMGGASGAYLFGSQRLWYRHPGYDNSGISAFYQYGINNASALSMKQYIGGGFTAFGLVPNRPDDSIGVGTAISWLNQNIFARRSETMYQIYYQAKAMKYIYLEPVLSYIPNPGSNPTLNAAWAGTLRAIVLF